jgi:hypothetical protein
VPAIAVKALACAAGGLAYGCLLAALGLIAAGAGHGTTVVGGLASAPLGLFGFGAALAGAPALWGTAGALLGLSRSRAPRAALLALLLAHYAGLPLLLCPPGHFADWSYVRRVADIVAVAFVVYAAGQVALWVALVREWRAAASQAREARRFW